MVTDSEPILPTRSSSNGGYGAIGETPPGEGGSAEDGKVQRWRLRTGEMLESQRLHQFVIALIAIDATFVLIDLSYTFLHHCQCPSGSDGSVETENPMWIEVLSHISLGITTLFLLEIPLTLWAFGWRFFDPVHGERYGYRHTGFHLFDAVVIVGTFVVEVFLKGREKELASLVVLLRLWRLLKLVGGVAVGVDEYNEQDAVALHSARDEVEKLRKQVQELQEELDKRRTFDSRMDPS